MAMDYTQHLTFKQVPAAGEFLAWCRMEVSYPG